jgi:hypothetical protein
MQANLKKTKAIDSLKSTIGFANKGDVFFRGNTTKSEFPMQSGFGGYSANFCQDSKISMLD